MSKINGVEEIFQRTVSEMVTLFCTKTVCLQYSGSSLTDMRPGFIIGFFTARSVHTVHLNWCMLEDHALIDCILCFVIVTSGFLDLHLESTRGGRCIFRAFIDMRCRIFGIRTGVANGLNSLQRGV